MRISHKYQPIQLIGLQFSSRSHNFDQYSAFLWLRGTGFCFFLVGNQSWWDVFLEKTVIFQQISRGFTQCLQKRCSEKVRTVNFSRGQNHFLHLHLPEAGDFEFGCLSCTHNKSHCSSSCWGLHASESQRWRITQQPGSAEHKNYFIALSDKCLFLNDHKINTSSLY